MRFVDANIFLRAITEDDPIKAEACKALLRRVDSGEEEITTCEAVISEVVYVLLSPRIYGLDRREIRARLSPLLRMRGLRLARKHLYLEALDIYAQHPALDFEDVLCVVHMQHAGIDELLSYDRDFDRLGGINRVEP